MVRGGFNNVLAPAKRVGSMVSVNETIEFKNCVSDLKYKGCFFTWNNKQEGANRIFCKLDRVLCNEE